MHANFSSLESTTAGSGSWPGRAYHTFTAKACGVAGSTCSNNGELMIGHMEKTKVPFKMKASSGAPGKNLYFWGHFPMIQGLSCNSYSNPLPQSANKGTHLKLGAFMAHGHVRVALCPWARPSGAGKIILPCCPKPGLSNSSHLVTRCWMGSTDQCTKDSTGTSPCFQLCSFKVHRTDHNFLAHKGY